MSVARVLRAAVAAAVAGALVTFLAVPAHAGGTSLGSNPLNVLAVTQDAAAYAQLAGQLAGSGVPPSAEVSAYQTQMLATGTTAAVAAEGLTVKPGGSGRVGMVLNTVAVLGGLAMLWGGGEDAPAVPGVQTGEYTLSQCSGGAWAGGSGASISCGGFISLVAGSTGRYWFRSGREVVSGTSTASVTISDTSNAGTSVKRGAGPYLFEAWTAESAVKNDGAGNYWTPAGTRVGTYWIGNIPSGSTQPMPSNPNPVTPPASVPHTITSTAQCMDTGGVVHTITNTSSSFTFNPAASVMLPEVPDIACPTGQWLKSGERHLDTPGTTQTVPLVDPYEAPGWVQEQATQFPECFPVGAAVCQLKLFQIATTGHPEYDCHAYPPGGSNPCADWWLDEQRREHYECRFGATPLAHLRRCEPYKTTFTTGVLSPSPADPDVDTDPVVGVDPTPEQTPDVSGCVPNVGAQLLNPWWMYKALKCATVWAFVPSGSVTFSDLPNPLPVGWLPDLTVDGPSGCGVVTIPSLNLGSLMPSTGVRVLFDSCADPWPLVRSVTYYGLLASALVSVGNRAFRAVMAALGMAVEAGGP